MHAAVAAQGVPTSPPSWHAMPAGEVAATLGCDPERGLGDGEVRARREQYGPNELPRAQRRALLRIFVGQFRSPLIYLLGIAAGVSLTIGEVKDAAFIVGVLVINAIIGTVQEARAESSAEALDSLIRQRVLVLRDGHTVELDSERLVPGDIVQLQSGSLVPVIPRPEVIVGNGTRARSRRGGRKAAKRKKAPAKRGAKKAAKKSAKKRAAGRAAKKRAGTKRAAKKASTKRPAKKRPAKKAAKKRTARKAKKKRRG